MSTPALQVTIVDSTGSHQRFDVEHVQFDFGSGSIDIQPGRQPFCRRFEKGVMTLSGGIPATALKLITGMASLMGHSLSVRCRRVIAQQPEEALSPEAVGFHEPLMCGN